MEKSFNDQELADIMSEIENLEREFTDAPAEAKAAPEAAPAGPKAPEVEGGVLHKLAVAPPEQTVLKTNHAAEPHAGSGAASSMSFEVRGDMAVNLAFEVNGQRMSLAVNESGICIEMESGAKFQLPFSKNRAA